MAVDGGCVIQNVDTALCISLFMIYTMNKEYKAWGALKSVLSNRG